MAVAIKLVADEAARLGAGRRVGDSGRAAHNGAVEGEHAGPVDELGAGIGFGKTGGWKGGGTFADKRT